IDDLGASNGKCRCGNGHGNRCVCRWLAVRACRGMPSATFSVTAPARSRPTAPPRHRAEGGGAMFDRSAQVNARFAGGSPRLAEVVAALRALGLGEEQINVIERADPGEWQEPAAPGWVERLKGRLGYEPAVVAALPPNLLILVHLGGDEALAGEVQDLFRR